MQESLRLPRWSNFRGIDVHVVLHFALSILRSSGLHSDIVGKIMWWTALVKIDATSVSSFAQTQLR